MPRQIWKPGNMLFPLPAVMVSCQNGERPNIITLAWAGTICSDPAMVSVSIRKERFSYGIIRETGEFVINLTTKELARATDFCGVRSGRDVDKFKEMSLTESLSSSVNCPGIAESPVNIECKVRQILPLGSHDMFVSEVTAVSVDERYLDSRGKFRVNDSRLMVFSHGEYFEVGESLGKFGFSVKKSGRQGKH